MDTPETIELHPLTPERWSDFARFLKLSLDLNLFRSYIVYRSNRY